MGNSCNNCKPDLLMKGSRKQDEKTTIIANAHIQDNQTKTFSIKSQNKENLGISQITKKTFREETVTEEKQTEAEEKPQQQQQKHIVNFDKFIRVKHQKASANYSMIRKLGQGSFGSVYKVRCRKTGEQRAMKIIKKHDVTDQQNVFAQLEILKKLDHPNIVKLYQVLQEEDFFCVVTQYCDGGELMASLKKQKTFSEKKVAKIMRELLGAVVYMHQRSIVHRDLKLQNILYDDRKEQSSMIKIIDFGTSRLVHPDRALHAKMGSPFYVAPEVLQRNYNIKCDVWSCGVIMYIMFCGYPPFQGHSTNQIFSKIINAPLKFKDSVWAKVSSGAKSLIKSMLNRDTKMRPSASAILNSDWVQNCNVDLPIDNKILGNLQNFYYRSRFKAIIVSYLASSTISKAERKVLARKFNEIDKDRSGVIDRQQLVQAYQSVYPVVNEEQIQRILDNIDANGSGQIDFTEFMAAAYETQKLMREENLYKAFDFFDTDGTGYIDINELKELFGDVSDEELLDFMKQIDTNLDQKISKDQFLKMLREVNS